ncbi:MAG: BMP family ABC transporter substrate-binding protein [Ruminococcus sp.]|nr:BMP family ABC transporter substrate-binding protein [Ruminococcus sp.]
MKKSLAALLAVLLIFGCAALTACSKKRLSTEAGDSQIISADEIADTMTSKDGKYEIAMVTNVGRLKDKSFNQGTWDGVKLFAYKNGKSIGVDVDQSSVSDTVITSAMKGLSSGVQKILTSFYAGKWVLVGGLSSNLGVDDNAVGLPFATSKFEKFTEGDYVKLVNSMKSGGTLEVKNDFSAFLAGGETFENVAVSFVK